MSWSLNKLLQYLGYLQGDRPIIILDEKNRRFEITNVEATADALHITLQSDDEE